MTTQTHHADESLVADAAEARRAEGEGNPIDDLHTLLRRMPGGDAVARSMLRTIACELEMASMTFDLG
jgi:hypothetical protein